MCGRGSAESAIAVEHQSGACGRGGHVASQPRAPGGVLSAVCCLRCATHGADMTSGPATHKVRWANDISGTLRRRGDVAARFGSRTALAG
jgi:hypothetical protein